MPADWPPTVKREPEATEPTSEPNEVPPSIVLEKLEALLKSGRLLLAYEPSNLKGYVWGVNGKIDDQWCSFRLEGDGACEFVDDEIWQTEGKDDWGEGELIEVKKLHDQLFEKTPVNAAGRQPKGWQPQACRRAVFDFYRAKHRASGGKGLTHAPTAKAHAKAKAKAPAAKAPPAKAKAATEPPPESVLPATAKAGVGGLKRPFSAPSADAEPELIESDDDEPPAEEPAPDPAPEPPLKKAAAPIGKQAGGIPKQPAHAPPKHLVPSVAKTGAPKQPAHPPPQHLVAEEEEGKDHKSILQDFLALAKPLMLGENKKAEYIKLIKLIPNLKDKAIRMEVLGIIKPYASLYESFRKVIAATNKGSAQKPPAASPAKSPAAKAPAAKAPVGKSPAGKPSCPYAQAVAATRAPAESAARDAQAVVTKRLAQVEKHKAEVLKKMEVVKDAQAKLIRLVCGERGVRASVRQQMLKYLKSKCVEGRTGELILMRGPSSCGKSTWAFDQVKTLACLIDEDESGENEAAKLLHICSEDDFAVTCVGIQESYAEPETADDACRHEARNLARVQLAMELGVEPVYVDNAHLQLHEMQAYAKLAESSGYSLRVVAPDELEGDWKDVSGLLKRDRGRGTRSKKATKDSLQAEVEAFEPLADVADPGPAILQAKAKAMPRRRHAIDAPTEAPAGKAPEGKAPVGKSPAAKAPLVKAPGGKSPIVKAPGGKAAVAGAPQKRPGAPIAKGGGKASLMSKVRKSA